MPELNQDYIRDFVERGRRAQEAANKIIAGFTCPRCQMTSHHPKDIEEGYCGNCHDWTGGGAA